MNTMLTSKRELEQANSVLATTLQALWQAQTLVCPTTFSTAGSTASPDSKVDTHTSIE